MNASGLVKLRNAGWLLAERGVGLAVGFLVMTLVARHLGPDRFGAYAYLFGIAALAMPLAQAGLEAVIMRRFVADPGGRDATIGAALAIRAAGGLAAAALATAAVALAGGPEGTTAVLMALASLPLLAQTGEVFNAWFKANERMAWVVVPRIAVALATAGGALALVAREEDLGAFVALRSVEGLALGLAAVLAFGAATGSGRSRLPSVPRSTLAAMLREGWPLTLSAIAVALYMRVDQVMLGHLADEAELGRYSVAVRVSDVALAVPMALQASFFASMVRAHAAGPERLAIQSQRLYDAMALAALGSTVALAVGATILFVPLFGAPYAPALPMVLVLALALPWAFLGVARSAVLVVQGWLWTSPATTLAGAVANIALNFALIPDYGGLGAAWATVLSYWLAAHGCSLVLPWLRPEAWAMTRALNPVGATARLLRGLGGEAARRKGLQ